MLCQEMELLFVGHWSTSFTTGQDDSLTFFRYCELTSKFCSGSKKTADARSDVVVHTVFVEICHLFLYGTIDTRVTCMETHYEFSFVIEFLHQVELLLKVHSCR